MKYRRHTLLESKVEIPTPEYNPLIDYTEEPFTIEALSDGTVTVSVGASVGAVTALHFVLKHGEQEISGTITKGPEHVIEVFKGDTIKFWDCVATALAISGGQNDPNKRTQISSTAWIEVYGHITSLLTLADPTHPITSISTNFTFTSLFNNCTKLVDARYLKLPSNTTASCYRGLFNGCINLIEGPHTLPASTVLDYSYGFMFRNCTSLIEIPTIYLQTLGTGQYHCAYMFYNCKKLKTPMPTLHSTTLRSYCYAYMFYGCSSLLYAPELPATTLTTGCYNYMFYGCSSLSYINTQFITTPSTNYTNNWVTGYKRHGYFVKNASARWTTTGNYGAPNTWYTYKDLKKITNAFPLPCDHPLIIENIVGLRVEGMRLSHELYVSYDGENYQRVDDIGDLHNYTLYCPGKLYLCGDLTQDPSSASGNYTRLELYGSEIRLSGRLSAVWYIDENQPKHYPYIGYRLFVDNPDIKYCDDDLLAEHAYHLDVSCYESMFERCTSLIKAPSLPSYGVPEGCYWGMFRNCEALRTAPRLPAYILQNNCYANMFYGCTSLSHIECMATDISAYKCTEDWLRDVASDGVFIKNASTQSWVAGPRGIPSGWTVVDEQDS